jgi:excisionase family DNA binding protein
MREKGRIKMPDGYISTGEAAKMLGISRSTVNRLFSQRVLTREKHPITNLRRIKKASVLALMKKHGMKWKEHA